MPEGVEIEIYRRAAEAVVGRTVEAVDAPDSWYLKGDTSAEALHALIPGSEVTAADRIGKLLLLRFDGPQVEGQGSADLTLGLRFGMTGRLVIDDSAPIQELEYSSNRGLAEWDRFGLRFADPPGGSLVINDPRRLGGAELDPDESKLGADLFSFKPSDLRRRVLVGAQPLKARLLDQSRLAGVGNLIADETLWRAGLHPGRAAGSLTEPEVRKLVTALRQVAKQFLAKGGSHMGRLQSSRVRGGLCPKDGVPLDRGEIGGRTTYSCPEHQPWVD